MRNRPAPNPRFDLLSLIVINKHIPIECLWSILFYPKFVHPVPLVLFIANFIAGLRRGSFSGLFNASINFSCSLILRFCLRSCNHLGFFICNLCLVDDCGTSVGVHARPIFLVEYVVSHCETMHVQPVVFDPYTRCR